MQTIQSIEAVRIKTQHTLDNAKTQSERNKLGQFATPSQLSLEIIRESMPYLTERQRIRFLDPAFGTGAFYSALLHTIPSERIESASGFEIDPHYGDEAKRLWGSSFLNLSIRDFFSVSIPKEEGKSNLIVCNPPYVRHHHLSTTQKEFLSGSIMVSMGLKVNGLSGLYCYFLLYADRWLADDGIGCWLIPTEFMDVNYGTIVKEYLSKKVSLLRIHRFDPAESQFEDALVSSAVVWFKKKQPRNDQSVEFTFGGTLESPRTRKAVSLSDLAKVAKWTRFTNGHQIRKNNGFKLSDFFDVKRGLATGANDFFMLTPDAIKKYKVPSKFLIPILPSPRYLNKDVVKADKKGMPLIEKPKFLLSCKLLPSQVKKEFPSLWKYFEEGIDSEIDKRYLCHSRTPWYAQEERSASPFLCTYMGRHNSPKESPFRFILNLSRATAANVYLNLYPKPFLSRFINEHPSIKKRIWEGLNNISSESLIEEGRVYGGGLHKMEPRELANTSAESLLASLPELGYILSSEKTKSLSL